MLQQYLNDLFKTAKAGDAREESYYPDLKKFLENWNKDKKFHVTSLPKKTEAGNPDFRVWDGKQHIVGYIEAKDPKINLDSVETSEQLTRYRGTFPNLILTNFFEFRLYRNGQRIDRTIIGQPFALIHKISEISPVQNQKKFTALLAQFFSFSIPQTYTAKQLAIELAKRTRFLRDQVIKEELKEEKVKGSQTLEGFYKAFKDHLIVTLTLQDFSNLFAQTITYGLFAARSRADKDFNRKLAHDYIPHTIGILRDVFRFISSTDLPQSMEWITDDIAEVLAVADVKKIISSFYKEAKGKDPIIHFYETFLTEYDPKEREKRGVYYTPEPVVGYIVRSIHQLLKEKFNKEDGFATQSVTVLDPAAGTLTFPAEAIKLAVEEYQKKYGSGGIKSLIKDHILKNFYAFELMMAPYAVGHLKIGFVLDEIGYHLSKNERFNLYLTNTLEFTKEDPNSFPGIFEKTIAHESAKALKVKENVPVMVIIGNPPYSGNSDNKGDWILKQMKEYKQIEGQSLGEKNPKWLMDDYVKFFRFAQWKIEQSKVGIIGFITNHAWLDNPTFKGMRYSFLKSFDEIYILNLHGSTLKKEKTSSGGKDENVFDIQPGVSITLALKTPTQIKKQIFYADLYGLRNEKYQWLETHDFNNTKWEQLNPADPFFFFVPKQEKGRKEYQKFTKITDIFPVNSVGVVTGRDEFVIDLNKNPLESRIRLFVDDENDDSFFNLKDKPKSKWYVKEARKKLRETNNWRDYFTRILYRPFDERWIYYHPAIIERSRKTVMKHLLQPNLALMTLRKGLPSKNYSWVFVSNELISHGIFFNGNQSTEYIFPLYLHDDEMKEKQISLIESSSNQKSLKSSNINWDVLPEMYSTINPYTSAVTKEFVQQPEAIFYYIYAVLYSNVYRDKYQEFLQSDFPRIPFTLDYQIFLKLALLGERLVKLHLLQSKELEHTVSQCHGQEAIVEKPLYDEKLKVLRINKTQYFNEIKPEVWNYNIGGYQVLDKWLKDRKGRPLSAEDIKHYCQIITSLEQTIEIQKQIDKFYLKIEKRIIS
ncbi:MAG: type ISP restriction/modification enzyme [Patescibacteria group bacterium]